MQKIRRNYIENRDCDLLQSNDCVNRMQNNMEIDETSSADLSSISLFSGVGSIEHPVSKFDTLAGIAIKYGVEVSDIKRMNALVTDHQMFALKSLQIPTPGKHPSPHLSEDLDISRKSNCEQNSSRIMSYNLFDSFQSLRIKSSTTKAQAHHGNIPAICEITPHRKGESNHLGADPSLTSSSTPRRSHHRKSRSFANGFPFENVEFTDIVPAPNGATESIKGGEKLVRRRQKSMADFSAATENLFNKPNNTSSSECLTTTATTTIRKSLDVRLKGAARINAANGSTNDLGKLTPILMDDVGDSFMATNGISCTRRSSSTCNLQDAEKGSSSSMWSASSWSLKTDLQALSSAVVTKSIFDGLPKATTTRYKASMD